MPHHPQSALYFSAPSGQYSRKTMAATIYDKPVRVLLRDMIQTLAPYWRHMMQINFR
jgi:hypothetical protein